MKIKIITKRIFALIIFLGVILSFNNSVFAIVDSNNSLSVVDINLSKTDIEENSEVGAIVGSFNSSDNWSVDDNFADGRWFSLDKDDDKWNLKVKFSPDYERRSKWFVRILKLDSDDNAVGKKEFSINILDVNQKIKDLNLSPQKINLFDTPGRMVGIFEVDDDGEDGRWTLRLEPTRIENPNRVKPSCRDEDRDGVIFKYDSDDNGNGVLDYGKDDSDWEEGGKGDNIIDVADADADNDGVVDEGKTDENGNGIDDDIEKIMKNCESMSQAQIDGNASMDQNQPEYIENDEPDYFNSTDVFKIVGRNLYVKDDWDFKGGDFPIEVTVSDGKIEHDITKEFTVRIYNEKYTTGTYVSDGGGSNLLMSIIGLAVAGYFICYQGAAAYSAPSQAVDILSVPTNNIGDKMFNSTVKAAKSCGLDFAANALKKKILQGIIQSLTKWVKGGFKGSPSFLSDPQQFLNDASGGILGSFVNGSSGEVICSQFRVPLKFAINEMIQTDVATGGISSNGSPVDQQTYDDNGYNLPSQDLPNCTIPVDITDNDYFGELGNFVDTDGKLDVDKYWSQMIMAYSPNNDMSSVLFDVENTLNSKIKAIEDENARDAERGNGFLSIRKCERVGASGYSSKQASQECLKRYSSCLSAGTVRETCDAQKTQCFKNNVTSSQMKCHYTTPGAIVENEVAETVGVERKSVELADSFNELIFALIGQLIKSIFSNDDGLSGTVVYDVENMPEDPIIANLSGAKDYIVKIYNKEGYTLARDLRNESVNILETYKEKLDDILDKIALLKNDDKVYFLDNGDVFLSETVGTEPNNHRVVNSILESIRKKIVIEIVDLEGVLDKARIKRDESPKWEDVSESVDAVKNATTSEDLARTLREVEKYGKPDVTGAFRDYSDLVKINNSYYGARGFSGAQAYYYGGFVSVWEYLGNFKSTTPDGDSQILTMNTFSHIMDMKLLNVDESGIISAVKTQDFQTRVSQYGYRYINSGFTGDDTNIGNSDMVVIPASMQYYSLVNEKSPAASTGKDGEADNWKDFFTKVPSVKMGSTLEKQADSPEVLSFLSDIQKKKPEECWDSRGSGQSVNCYDYSFYKLPIEHFAYYNDPNIKDTDKVNGIAGQGKYVTIQQDGRSWESYKIYIPPFANKIVLLFKPNDENYDNYLYRIHMTYKDSIIDHRDVKALEYIDSASDDEHSGLDDLFLNGKTVLLNITDYAGNIDDNINLTGGIYTSGLVLDRDKINEYIGEKGGWLYFDIIQDTFVREKPQERTSLRFAYYMGVDSDRRASWIPQMKINLEEKDYTVIDIDDDKDRPIIKLIGQKEMNFSLGDKFEDPGYSATSYDQKTDLTDEVIVSELDFVDSDGNIDERGTYYIIYKVSDSETITMEIRTIIID